MTAAPAVQPAPLRSALSPPLAAALLGVGTWVFLPVGGRLSVLEIVAVALLPPCLVAMVAVRWGRRIVLGSAAWIAGTVAATVVHPAAPRLVVLQIAGILAVTAAAALLYRLLRDGDDRTRAVLIASFGVGEIVGVVVSPPSALALGLWKFGLGQAVTVLVLASIDRFGTHSARKTQLAVLATVFLAAVHLVLGSRGLALFSLIVLVGVTLLPSRRWSDRRRLAGSRIVLVVVAAVAGGLILQSTYERLAVSGRLGSDEQMKVAFQSGDLGLLVGGRKDFVFLASAIAHSPVFGWGPAAVANPEAKNDAVDFLAGHGYEVLGYDYLVLVLPDKLYLHSEVLGAWVTAGVLALPFWLVALVLLWRAMLAAFARRALAESFLMVVAVWHLFFSPLGDITRGHLALGLALGLVASARLRPGAQPADQ